MLTIYDPAAALGLQGRHTRLAFAAGDPDAIARGRALEVVTLASMDEDDARVARLEARVRDARARMAPGAVRADIDLLLGLADGYRSRFPESFAQLDAAAEDRRFLVEAVADQDRRDAVAHVTAGAARP